MSGSLGGTPESACDLGQRLRHFVPQSPHLYTRDRHRAQPLGIGRYSRGPHFIAFPRRTPVTANHVLAVVPGAQGPEELP